MHKAHVATSARGLAYCAQGMKHMVSSRRATNASTARELWGSWYSAGLVHLLYITSNVQEANARSVH
jgi:hypothetical protein